MDPYQLLGVTRDCGPEELKEAFRTKALLVHPDRGGDDGDFIELRRAFDQITDELSRRPPRMNRGPSRRDAQSDRSWNRNDPDWQPDLIVQEEPLPRIRPVRPPNPDWQPDLIVRDEPLPRIRPARPPDANWRPDMILGDDEAGIEPGPPAPAPDGARQQYVGWMRDVVTRSGTETPSESEGWYALAGLTVIAFVVLLGLWIASRSQTDAPPTNPADLTATPWRELEPRSGNTTVPDWPAASSRVPQVPMPGRPAPSAGARPLQPRR